MKTTAVLYIRVSTQEQATQGHSLQAQEKALRAYCEAFSLSVVAVVKDAAVSGKTPLQDREGGKQLLQLLKSRKAYHVVAFKLDRLFRSCRDCLNNVEPWEKKRISLHLLDMSVNTSTASGKFFLTVMAGAAEMERKMISERVEAALSLKKSKGERISRHPPMGYKFNRGRLVPDPKEQESIRLIKTLRESGSTYHAILDYLHTNGIPARGKKWHLATLQTILAS